MIKQEEEDPVFSHQFKPNSSPVANVGPMLLKKLDVSTCYEPFLQTEGPKLTWLRDVIESTSPASDTAEVCQSAAKRALKSDVLVYKTLAKDLRTLRGCSVLVTVLLSSRGNSHITCKGGSDAGQSTVDITDSDLEQSQLLRPDLQTLTPKWADWIITKVRCDSRLSFYIDLSDAEGTENGSAFREQPMSMTQRSLWRWLRW